MEGVSTNQGKMGRPQKTSQRGLRDVKNNQIFGSFFFFFFFTMVKLSNPQPTHSRRGSIDVPGRLVLKAPLSHFDAEILFFFKNLFLFF
jgi:hypothetical protein